MYSTCQLSPTFNRGSDLGTGLAAARAGAFGLGKVVLDDGDGKVLEIGDAAASAAGLGADPSGVGGIGVLGKRDVLDGPGLERGREVEQQLAEICRKTDGWAESIGAGPVEPLEGGEEPGLEQGVARRGVGERGVSFSQPRFLRLDLRVAFRQHHCKRSAQRLEFLDVVGEPRGIDAVHGGMRYARGVAMLQARSGRTRNPGHPLALANRFTRRTLRRSMPSSSIASSLGRSSMPRTSGAAFGKRNVPASSRLYQRAGPSRSQ